jgi:hypothetical protein
VTVLDPVIHYQCWFKSVTYYYPFNCTLVLVQVLVPVTVTSTTVTITVLVPVVYSRTGILLKFTDNLFVILPVLVLLQYYYY